jgi:hypothetical protein
VLAREKDLAGMIDPVDGPLDDARADPATMPTWLEKLPDIEAESGHPDGPAIMMTLQPRKKAWKVPDVGLGVDELPAPERLTLVVEVDKKGWHVRGNLKFKDEETAQQFLEQVQAAQQTALDTTLIRAGLERANLLNAVKGLTLARTDRRVAYSTSVSIADARAIAAMGTLLVADYFRELQEKAGD